MIDHSKMAGVKTISEVSKAVALFLLHLKHLKKMMNMMCNSLAFVLPKNPKGFIRKVCFRNACTTDSQNYQRKSK